MAETWRNIFTKMFFSWGRKPQGLRFARRNPTYFKRQWGSLLIDTNPLYFQKYRARNLHSGNQNL